MSPYKVKTAHCQLLEMQAPTACIIRCVPDGV